MFLAQAVTPWLHFPGVSQFELLAAGVTEYPKVWAPFYTLHKIMAGLLDMYVHTGNEQAIQVAEGIAGWVNAYFEGIGDGSSWKRVNRPVSDETPLTLLGFFAGAASKRSILNVAEMVENILPLA